MRQSELEDESGKTWEVNVQDVTITYPVDELPNLLPDKKLLDMQLSVVDIQN